MARAVGPRLALFYGAAFAAVGVQLPFWPVWLAAQGLSAAEIGLVLAAAFWPRVATNLLIAYQADRLGRRKPLMVGLAAATVLAIALFALATELRTFLVLSALSGTCWAAIGPLGEALALQELARRGISYGRVRLWGSLTFVLAAAGTGHLIERSGAGLVLGLLLGFVALTLLACLLLPESTSSDGHAEPPRLAALLRLRTLWRFVFAAGLIQVSHALYYGFASLHWRAAGHSGTVVGLLWAEGVIAEILLLACAGALLRWREPQRLLVLAGALTVLRWSVTALGSDLALLVPVQLLHGASFGATYLATMHYLRDHAPPGLQASAQAINASIGFALLFGLVTPVAGWLYAAAGGSAFWAMAALALAGTGLSATVATPRG
ncbi:MAG TPA: MFS transporter [Geminicoccaceae bacterium]|nr:MFS transporter [Geminicoccaceae bacterium]